MRNAELKKTAKKIICVICGKEITTSGMYCSLGMCEHWECHDLSPEEWNKKAYERGLPIRKFAKKEYIPKDAEIYPTLHPVFSKLCQKCAEDKTAWHTRPAFCKHKQKNENKT